jgi:hypothetical protein
MELDINKLPKKAQLKAAKHILLEAEDKLYCIVQTDYKTGMVKLESLIENGIFINIYLTTLTTTIEIKIEGERTKQFHFKKLTTEEITKILSNPKNYIINNLT